MVILSKLYDSKKEIKQVHSYKYIDQMHTELTQTQVLHFGCLF